MFFGKNKYTRKDISKPKVLIWASTAQSIQTLFLKTQKFPDKIIFAGQKLGWIFARKDNPKIKWNRPMQRSSFGFEGK